MRRAARYLAISSKKSICALKKKRQAWREVVDVEAALDGLLDVGEAVLERERELLLRGRPSLADVVAGDRDRVPARHLARAPLDHVAAQAHRRVDREAPLLLRDVLLEDVGLDRAGEPLARDGAGGARAGLGGGDVEGEHDRRGRVDRHRDADRAEVDAAEQRLHVIQRVHSHTLTSYLSESARVVGVVTHQRRHVERRREAGLTVVEQVAEALVRLLARAEAGELAHRPEPPAVHRGVDAARERVLAGAADRIVGRADAGRQVGGRVELAHGLAGERAELALGGGRRVVGARLGGGCHVA